MIQTLATTTLSVSFGRKEHLGKMYDDMRPGFSSKSIVNKNIKDEIYLLFVA